MLPTGLPAVIASQMSATTPGEIQRVQVDSEAAEAFISEKRIGERIKYLRLKKSMGLVELGRHTGLSASFLSQLETGRVVPTAAKSGADCDGLLKGSELLLRS